MPLRVLLMCWGPYVLMCIYACFENVKVVSPKLRMVNIGCIINLVTFENVWASIGNIYIYFMVSVTPSDVMICYITHTQRLSFMD